MCKSDLPHQCYKKPRKVCQTLVTTKPKVVTEQVLAKKDGMYDIWIAK